MTRTTVKRVGLTLVTPNRNVIYHEDIMAINAIANMIGAHRPDEHPALLGLLLAALERAGVDVPEGWRCMLEEG